jgi:AraC-like DNA-binding protein
MTYTSRSAILTGFAETLADFGYSPLPFLRRADLALSVLSEPELRVPSASVVALLEDTARETGIVDLGLRMADARRLSTLGALGMLMRDQSDVLGAMRVLAANGWTQSEGLSFEIEHVPPLTLFTLDLDFPGETRQAAELTLAAVVRFLQRFLGTDWRPEMVQFRHATPAGAVGYAKVFGHAPLFSQERNALVVLDTDLGRTIPDADPAAAGLVENYLAYVAGLREASMAERTTRVIRQLLPRGSARAEQVARQFGMTRRTLHRQLTCEGTSFSALLNAERLRLAETLLASRARSKTELAGMLGFASLSAFSRWYCKAVRFA